MKNKPFRTCLKHAYKAYQRGKWQEGQSELARAGYYVYSPYEIRRFLHSRAATRVKGSTLWRLGRAACSKGKQLRLQDVLGHVREYGNKNLHTITFVENSDALRIKQAITDLKYPFSRNLVKIFGFDVSDIQTKLEKLLTNHGRISELDEKLGWCVRRLSELIHYNKTELIYQTDCFSEDGAEVKGLEIVKKYWPNVVAVTSTEAFNIVTNNPYTPFRGSLTLASRLRYKSSFTDASYWGPMFRGKLVSEDFRFLDVQGLIEYDLVWPLFVRPVAGNKMFSGNVYSKEKFLEEVAFMRSRNIGNILCMYATPRLLTHEYRLIIIEGKVVSGSRYMVNGELSIDPEVPSYVVLEGNAVAEALAKENIMEAVADFAITDKGPQLIELNDIHTSSFYAADLDAIYKAWADSYFFQRIHNSVLDV